MRNEAASVGLDDEHKTREELLLELRSLRESRAMQQVAIEQAWRYGEEKFKALADASMAGILVYQGEETVYVNRALANIEGYPVEERIRMKFWETTHPAFRDDMRKRGDDRQKGLDVPSRNELKVIRKDGEERWIVTSSGTFTLRGKPAVMLIIQDITELKRAEEALKKSQYILAKAQQIAHVGNWAWNVRTGQMNWSDEGFRIFGYEPGEVRPTMDWVLSRVHPDDRQIMLSFEEAVRERKRCSVDYRIIRPDGSIRYVNSVADKIIIGRSGVPERAYGINQDVTERKQAGEALSHAKNEAELYVDLMGHDINNMNQITMGYLELAHNIMEFEGKLGMDNAHLLEKASDSLNNSSRLIDNVRKMQRAKMGLYEPEIIDVGALLEELVEQFRSIPNRDVHIEYEPHGKYQVKANALLKDVFLNIIGNSIKHSTGPLEIRIEADSVEQDGERYCRVAVEDNGPGIPDMLKLTLFDRLNLASTRARGKGFGLCLIKMLVDDYGGSFRVEDRVEGDCSKGCRFVVLLPSYD
jgi:PAS domain S-box-containing protein